MDRYSNRSSTGAAHRIVRSIALGTSPPCRHAIGPFGSLPAVAHLPSMPAPSSLPSPDAIPPGPSLFAKQPAAPRQRRDAPGGAASLLAAIDANARIDPSLPAADRGAWAVAFAIGAGVALIAAGYLALANHNERVGMAGQSAEGPQGTRALPMSSEPRPDRSRAMTRPPAETTAPPAAHVSPMAAEAAALAASVDTAGDAPVARLVSRPQGPAALFNPAESTTAASANSARARGPNSSANAPADSPRQSAVSPRSVTRGSPVSREVPNRKVPDAGFGPTIAIAENVRPASVRRLPPPSASTRPSDPDVELLEAMVEHLGPRSRAASTRGTTIAQLVEQCALRATRKAREACRARICEGYWGQAKACPKRGAASIRTGSR